MKPSTFHFKWWFLVLTGSKFLHLCYFDAYPRVLVYLILFYFQARFDVYVYYMLWALFLLTIYRYGTPSVWVLDTLVNKRQESFLEKQKRTLARSLRRLRSIFTSRPKKTDTTSIWSHGFVKMNIKSLNYKFDQWFRTNIESEVN